MKNLTQKLMEMLIPDTSFKKYKFSIPLDQQFET